MGTGKRRRPYAMAVGTAALRECRCFFGSLPPGRLRPLPPEGLVRGGKALTNRTWGAGVSRTPAFGTRPPEGLVRVGKALTNRTWGTGVLRTPVRGIVGVGVARPNG